MAAAGNLLRWIALIVVSCLLCGLLLVSAEFGLRWWYSDVTTTRDNSSWFAHRWYQQDIGSDQSGLNSLRFRDREWSLNKPEGIFRIAIVGDSFTYGQGINREDRFGDRLAELIQDRGIDVEVMNLGKPGASARQNAFHLRMIEKYGPDFVLIQFTPNDFDDVKIESSVARMTVANLVADRDLHDFLHRRSALYFVVNSGYASVQSRASNLPSYPQWLEQRFSDAQSEEGKLARSHLQHLLRTAGRLSPGVGVVAFPMVDGALDGGYPYAAMHRIAQEVSGTAGVEWLDLLPRFAAYQGDAESLVLNRFDGHPSDVANAIAAEGILAHFFSHWRTAAAQ